MDGGSGGREVQGYGASMCLASDQGLVLLQVMAQKQKGKQMGAKETKQRLALLCHNLLLFQLTQSCKNCIITPS